jgi:hypothetical protein
VIDLHDGDGSFDALPSRVRDYIATTATNVLDWRSHLGWDASLRALDLSVPLSMQQLADEVIE